MTVIVQKEDFNPGEALSRFNTDKGDIGAITHFIGLVRQSHISSDIDQTNPAHLISMELEHYPQMTEKLLRDIQQKAQDRWAILDSLIIHRYGLLTPGDRIVLVAVAAEHRDESFQACAFLMDWLKTKAPFWKCERYSDGREQWIEAKLKDDNLAQRWDS